MTEAEMDAIVMAFPGAEKGMSYGRPSYKLNGKFFTRLRREEDSVVLLEVSFDEREMLIEAEPQTFHFTAHYKDYPSVLARIATLHPGSFRNFLDRRFRKIAKKAAVKDYDAANAGT
ncbi:MAG: MmcQ/YjbR family DNA-binding protein [Caulobacterales bacterium]